MTNARKHLAIIQGHPDPAGGHFCHALAAAYVDGATQAEHPVRLVDVARLDFPLIRSRDDLQHGVVPDSIRQAQDDLATADHIVLFYPVWNGGVPALLRGFFEQVFRPTFLFPDARPDERLGFTAAFTRRKSLSGKSARIVATMQMPGFLYRWYFHPHSEKSTLQIAGVRPIRQSFVGLVESSRGQRHARWLRTMHVLGQAAA
jgi:putative NADPH-quinone reductase